MRTKILILGLIFLVLIACKKGIENPYSPEPPDPTDVSYSCEFELLVSHDASATGDFYVSLLGMTSTDNLELGSLGVLEFSPLPDNPDVSEGTANFSATWSPIPPYPSGTYVLCLRLDHYNDLEGGDVTPGEWVIEATISEGFEFVSGGVFISIKYALVQVGRDTAWLTFSISD